MTSIYENSVRNHSRLHFRYVQLHSSMGAWDGHHRIEKNFRMLKKALVPHPLTPSCGSTELAEVQDAHFIAQDRALVPRTRLSHANDASRNSHHAIEAIRPALRSRLGKVGNAAGELFSHPARRVVRAVPSPLPADSTAHSGPEGPWPLEEQ